MMMAPMAPVTVVVIAMLAVRLAAALFRVLAMLFGMRLAAAGCEQYVFPVCGRLLAHDSTPPYDKDDPVYEGQLRSDMDNGTIWARVGKLVLAVSQISAKKRKSLLRKRRLAASGEGFLL